MEFFAIMAIGTLIAIWAVIGSRSTRKLYRAAPPLDLPRDDQGERNAEIWQSQPMDKVEYLEALERHEADPTHNPFPSPVPPRIQYP